MLRSGLLILLFVGTAPNASAQTSSIVGTVTDLHSRVPITGAAIEVVGSGLSGLTREDGRFLIVGLPDGSYELHVQRIGYEFFQRSITVTGGATLVVDVALSPVALDLEELIVTGSAGSARRREIGSAVTQLDLTDLPARPSSISDALQGVAVGVEITGGSGEAGQSKQIRLRGNTSIALSNQPLIYIDGVRMMDGAFPSVDVDFGLPEGARVTTSPIDIVNVADIERIEVVKGPAATTLFGTGAASGVIQIFTKRGSPGAPIWTAEIKQGTGWVKPFGANGVDYLHVEHYLRDAWWGGGYEGGAASRECVLEDPRWEGVNDSADGACSWPGAQWYQAYRLGVSGGVERFDYYVSGEYQNDTYTLPLDRLEKYGFRMNLRATLLPDLEVESHAAYSNLWTANTASGGALEGVLLNSSRGRRNLLSSADPAVIVQLFDFRNDQWIDRFTSAVTVTHAPRPQLSHRLTVGYDFSGQNLRSLREFGFVIRPDGGVTERDYRRRVGTVDYLGRYAFSLASNVRSTLSLGGQLVDDAIISVVSTGQGFSAAGQTTPGEAAIRQTSVLDGSTRNAGAFVQNVLDVSDRYFLTAGVRLDRHSTQGETFLRLHPKVSAAWVLSDESFWPVGLGAWRLRSAYGRSGSAASPFQQAFSYRAGAPADPPPGSILAPETSSEWELGVDGSVLDDRLSVGFTYYTQTTTDALVRVEEDVFPYRSDLRNIGKIRSRGIELQVDATVVRTGGWSLDAGLGLTTHHSMALDLGGAQPFRGLNSTVMVGQPVPVNFGRKVADPDAINGPWTPDRYAADADGVVGGAIPLGPQLPTHFLAPSISLRMPAGVILAARGEYRGGNTRLVSPLPVSRSTISALCLPYYVDPTSLDLELKADTPDLWQERCTPSGAADYWFDADYFKLRTVTATVPLGFLFPPAVSEPSLTIALDNVYSWYREVPWWDLEILGRDGANGDGLGTSERVPAPMTVSLTLRVTF